MKRAISHIMRHMLRHVMPGLLLTALSVQLAAVSHAATGNRPFGFVVVGQPAAGDDAALRGAVRSASQRHPEFIVVNGIRPQEEACSDAVYRRRKSLLEETARPLFVSLAARDWTECRNEKGDSLAQERLNFVRGLVFDTDPVARTKTLPTVRQSSSAKFRSYSENVRWESGKVLFATVNLPASNNHYLTAAGRNNEFEDRLIANRLWLQRVFSYAKHHKLKGIVLFADGNPMALPAQTARPNRTERRDGFAETRKLIISLAAKYPGKVLLLHAQPASGNIAWRDNVGVAGMGRGVFEIVVKPGAAAMYSVRRIPAKRVE